MLAGKIHHLRHLGLGNLVSVHAAFTDPVMMNVQHDLRRRLHILLEETLQHVNDEFHRRVIVVEDQHAIEARALRPRLDLRDDGSAGRPARRPRRSRCHMRRDASPRLLATPSPRRREWRVNL